MSLLPGIAAAALVMTAGFWLADVIGRAILAAQGISGSSPLSGVPIAIILGLLLRNLLPLPSALTPGLKFCVTTVLRLGIVLVGIRLSAFDLVRLGLGGLPVVLTAVAYLIFEVAGFGYRGAVIHTGTMFGTIMAANVWMRIWPAQRRIITATRDGEAPDPADPAVAGRRSKHNTYLSVPLVWAMLNQHTLTVGGASAGLITMLLAVAIGWGVVNLLYKKATQVKGF